MTNLEKHNSTQQPRIEQTWVDANKTLHIIGSGVPYPLPDDMRIPMSNNVDEWGENHDDLAWYDHHHYCVCRWIEPSPDNYENWIENCYGVVAPTGDMNDGFWLLDGTGGMKFNERNHWYVRIELKGWNKIPYIMHGHPQVYPHVTLWKKPQTTGTVS
jgi:hypothetical protein